MVALAGAAPPKLRLITFAPWSAAQSTPAAAVAKLAPSVAFRMRTDISFDE